MNSGYDIYNNYVYLYPTYKNRHTEQVREIRASLVRLSGQSLIYTDGPIYVWDRLSV